MQDFTARFKKETCQKTKSLSNSAESESEKEDKGKVKSEEQEKYFTRSIYQLKSNFQLSDRDKFICFNSMLNKNPYQDDDIEPPQAV